MKTTLKYCILCSEKPQEVFIGTRGMGARAQTLAQSTGAVAPVRPQKRGKSRVSAALLEPCAALQAARCPVCPLSDAVPNF